MHSMILGLLLCVPSLAMTADEKPKPATPKEQFDAMLKEFKEAEEAWNKQYNVEAGRESKVDWEARYLAWPGWSFAPRFLKLAEENTKDPVAMDALLQIVAELGQRVSENARQFLPYYTRAVEILARDHLNDRRLGDVCSVAGGQSPPAEKFLRTVLEKSQDHEVRAMACMGLASYLVKKRETALRPWFQDGARSSFHSFLIKNYDPSYAQYIQESSPQVLYAEADGLYERAIKDYGQIVYWQDPDRHDRRLTIADFATLELNKLRLDVGGVAPEIEGRDLGGKPMKLSDYRSKVVVLCFWGSWCPPCMAMVPHERSLVERLKGKPFVLLGVNGDEDREQAKKAIEKEKITWRSWSDGQPPGPIATRWGVRSWPMFYVLDVQGVIRYKFRRFGARITFDEEFEKVVDALVNALEAEKKRSG